MCQSVNWMTLTILRYLSHTNVFGLDTATVRSDSIRETQTIYPIDGIGFYSLFGNPNGIAVDKNGIVYVLDVIWVTPNNFNSRIIIMMRIGVNRPPEILLRIAHLNYVIAPLFTLLTTFPKTKKADKMEHFPSYPLNSEVSSGFEPL